MFCTCASMVTMAVSRAYKKYNLVKFVKLSGIGPSSILPAKSRYPRFFKVPISGGISPVIELLRKFLVTEMSTTTSVTVETLKCRCSLQKCDEMKRGTYKTVKLVRLRNDCGMFATKLFWFSDLLRIKRT